MPTLFRVGIGPGSDPSKVAEVRFEDNGRVAEVLGDPLETLEYDPEERLDYWRRYSYVPEEDGGEGCVRLYEGGHWEYGDRDEAFPVDRLEWTKALAVDQVWFSNKELADLVAYVAGAMLERGRKEMRERAVQRFLAHVFGP